MIWEFFAKMFSEYLTGILLHKILIDNKKGPQLMRPFLDVAGTGQLSNQIIADLQAFSELPEDRIGRL
jgi:hypothetical protein